MQPCLCCGYKTIPESGGYDICPVCFWEDEAYAFPYTDENGTLTLRVLYDEGIISIEHIIDLSSGANHGLTLRQGRENFLTFGACAEKLIQYVRKPLKSEM